MHGEIVIPGAMMVQLRHHLLPAGSDGEQAAFILAGVHRLNGRVRLLGHELIPVPPNGFNVQSSAFLVVKDEFSQSVLRRCRDEGLGLIETHSHPFVRQNVTFSPIDTNNEAIKFAYTASRIPGILHATMVFGQSSLDAHMWDAAQGSVVPINRVHVIDAPLCDLTPTSAQRAQAGSCLERTSSDEPEDRDERLARQGLAFGKEGQQRVAQCFVGIVGCGGTGSILAEQLAHLGVERFLLVDPDRVEASNLNRLVGATRADVRRRRFKVTVMRRLIRRISPKAHVLVQRRSVLAPQALTALQGVDVIFGCVDNDAARLALNRLAVQYLIPYIDLGTGLAAGTPGVLNEAGGQVRIVLPGTGFCLECIDGIDRHAASEQLLHPIEQAARRARGYGVSNGLEAPAVIFLNGVVVSLAVGEFLNLLTGYKPIRTFTHFDLLQTRVMAIQGSRRRDCPCCSQAGFLALGDLEPLPSYQPRKVRRRMPTPSGKP